MMIITLIATILAIVGCLNWLLVGMFGFNFVTWLLGAGVLSSIVFVLVGIAGIWLIFYLVYTSTNRSRERDAERAKRESAQNNKTARA